MLQLFLPNQLYIQLFCKAKNSITNMQNVRLFIHLFYFPYISTRLNYFSPILVKSTTRHFYRIGAFPERVIDKLQNRLFDVGTLPSRN